MVLIEINQEMSSLNMKDSSHGMILNLVEKLNMRLMERIIQHLEILIEIIARYMMKMEMILRITLQKKRQEV